MKLIFSLMSLFTLFSVPAEYRVYQYYIKANNPYSLDQAPYLVTSTLSPVSYQAYHGGDRVLKVDLLRSWMCYGGTARQMHCPPPLQTNEGTDGDY